MKKSTASVRKNAILKAAAALLAALLLVPALASCSNDDWYPAGMQLASDKDADYKLWVPSGWTVDLSTGVATAYVSDRDRTSVSLVAFNLRENPDVTAAEYWEENLPLLTSTFPDLQIEVNGDQLNIADVIGSKYVYTATVTNVSYRYTQILMVRAGYVYILTFTEAVESTEDHSEFFANIIEDFSFRDQKIEK